MKKGVLLLVIAFSLLFAPRLFAAQDSVWEMAKSDHYGRKAGGMLGRGLLNVATCFVDLIVQTVQGTQDGPPFVGTMTGLGGGIGCTALRVTSGALDVITFWVPGFNGIPVGRSYSNCLEMEEETSEPAQAAPGTAGAPETPAVEAKPTRHHHNSMDYIKK